MGDDATDRPRAPRDPDALVRRAGVRGDPRFDQHFLVDDRVLDRLPTHATDAGADLSHVLEIGAGTGGLTDRLLAVADHVTAIERDPELAAFLRDEFAEFDSRLVHLRLRTSVEVGVDDHPVEFDVARLEKLPGSLSEIRIDIAHTHRCSAAPIRLTITETPLQEYEVSASTTKLLSTPDNGLARIAVRLTDA